MFLLWVVGADIPGAAVGVGPSTNPYCVLFQSPTVVLSESRRLECGGIVYLLMNLGWWGVRII